MSRIPSVAEYATSEGPLAFPLPPCLPVRDVDDGSHDDLLAATAAIIRGDEVSPQGRQDLITAVLFVLVIPFAGCTFAWSLLQLVLA